MRSSKIFRPLHNVRRKCIKRDRNDDRSDYIAQLPLISHSVNSASGLAVQGGVPESVADNPFLCTSSSRSAGFFGTVQLCLLSLFTVYSLLFTASNAEAMHISEGILPLNWALLCFFIAAPFIIYGLYRLKKISRQDLSFKPLVGLLAAVVFIISCMPIPVPTAGTCSHPCGTGITGILLGPGISVLVASAALLIQALFLAHGGLSTLGGNILAMGVMGSLAGFLIFRFMRMLGVNIILAGFLAGISADWATYLTTSGILAAGLRGEAPFYPLFLKITAAFLPTQLPLGILEGAMTAGMVGLLYRKRPDLLVKMKVLRPEEVIL